MKIILCPSFLKQLAKLKSLDLSDIKTLIKKYPNTNKFLPIDQLEGAEVLKCYLLQNKIRSVVFFRSGNNNFIPVAIVRKETKKGKNITKDNYKVLFRGEILNIDKELNEKNFIIEEV